MYISRVRVATERLDRMALLKLLSGDAYSSHQLLWRLFPNESQRPFLFRQEMEDEQLAANEGPRGLALFYLVSTDEPVCVPSLLEVNSKPYSPKLIAGEQLFFRLRANPTIARKQPGEKRSRRHDVLMDAKWQWRQGGESSPESLRMVMDDCAIQWLADRSKGLGFELVSAPQVSGYRQHLWSRRHRQIKFSSIDYEGVLTVTDPELFSHTLFAGMGRSRAFGCGLLMVKRM